MKEEYDFSDAKRENPYIDRIKKHGYAIVVNCGAAQNSADETDLSVSSAESVAEKKIKYKNK